MKGDNPHRRESSKGPASLPLLLPPHPGQVFDFPLLKSFVARKDFSLIFDGMHAVTGPYAKRILVQVRFVTDPQGFTWNERAAAA